jgi:hypothetical protein
MLGGQGGIIRLLFKEHADGIVQRLAEQEGILCPVIKDGVTSSSSAAA